MLWLLSHEVSQRSHLSESVRQPAASLSCGDRLSIGRPDSRGVQLPREQVRIISAAQHAAV